jgi:hypothetical protein
MKRREAARIESAVDAGAAALFAAASAYALDTVLAGELTSAVGAAAAFGLCFVGLRRVDPFAAMSPKAEITPVTDLLAEADRSLAESPPDDDALVLEDVLAALDADSRVVRLFDPDAMPTAGQLKSRIDRHLAAGSEVRAPDDSQALHDALAELRRSLN